MKKIGIALCKIILVVVFGFFMFIQLQKPERSEADFSEVEEIVMNQMDEYGLVKQDNLAIKSTFSIDPAAYTNIAYYKSSDAMDVREVILVQFENEAMVQSFEKAAQNRIDSQINAFDGYAPEQVKLLKGAKVYSQVNFAIYVTSENSAEVVKAFKGAL